MTILSRVLLVFSVIGLASSWATAEEPVRNELSLFTLAALPATSVDVSPLSSSQKLGQPGPMLGLRYVHFILPNVGFGVEASYLERGKRTDLRSATIANTELVTQVTNRLLLAVVEWRGSQGHKLTPFLIGGAGIHRSDVEVALHPIPGYAWLDGTNDRVLSGQNTNAAGELKGGVDYTVFSNLDIGLEVGYMYLAPIGLHSEGLGATYKVQSTRPTLSLEVAGLSFSYRFAAPSVAAE